MGLLSFNLRFLCKIHWWHQIWPISYCLEDILASNLDDYFKNGGLSGSNLPNNNVNAMSLARTHWPMPSESWEMGAIPSRSPEAKPTGEGGIAPISKDEDGIGQCVRARLTVLTLLLCKLEATKVKPGKTDKVLRNTFCSFFKYFITMN